MWLIDYKAGIRPHIAAHLFANMLIPEWITHHLTI